MAEIIDFAQFAGEPDPEEMDREQLKARLEELRREIDLLDQNEPEDMESEEYDDWADQHEELEDQVDEILDLLDELDD